MARIVARLLIVGLAALPAGQGAFAAASAGDAPTTLVSLCTANGVVALVVDADGQPAPPAHSGKSCSGLCPVCVAGSAMTPVAAAVRLPAGAGSAARIVAATPRTGASLVFLLGNPYRGPPASGASS